MRRSHVVLIALAVLLAIGASIVVAAYRADLARARERIAGGGELLETKCGPIEYASVGEGPAVLLVHGAGGGIDQVAPFAKEIAARGFRVVSMSRFGYLRTPLPDEATPATQADAHACLLDALKIPRAAIIGVSAGGPSSTQFALRHAARCSALVLLVPMAWAPQAAERLAPPSPAARWMFETAIESDFLYWAAARASPTLVLESILGTPRDMLERADADEKARIAWMMFQPLPVSARRTGLRNELRIIMALERYQLERITAPALVISARDDFYGTYASSLYTARQIPGARFLGLPDGGHLWVGRHREVMGEIISFLSTSAR
jgi:2-hydroxy-6-oxonona-2,4-dienedioate hydrolase